jgi:hypothetical protein
MIVVYAVLLGVVFISYVMPKSIGAYEDSMNNELPPGFPRVPAAELISTDNIPSNERTIHISRWRSSLSFNQLNTYFVSELRGRFQLTGTSYDGPRFQLFFIDTQGEYRQGRIEIEMESNGGVEAIIYLGLGARKLLLYAESLVAPLSSHELPSSFFASSSIPKLSNMTVFDAATDEFQRGRSWTMTARVRSSLDELETSLSTYLASGGFQASWQQVDFGVIVNYQGNSRWGTISLDPTEEEIQVFVVVTDFAK